VQCAVCASPSPLSFVAPLPFLFPVVLYFTFVGGYTLNPKKRVRLVGKRQRQGWAIEVWCGGVAWSGCWSRGWVGAEGEEEFSVVGRSKTTTSKVSLCCVMLCGMGWDGDGGVFAWGGVGGWVRSLYRDCACVVQSFLNVKLLK